MKSPLLNRLFLLLLSIIACGCLENAIANCGLVYQRGWRWRNNDGSETSATWKAAQNVSIIQSGSGSILRLRIGVGNSLHRSSYNYVFDNYECKEAIAATLTDSLQYTTTQAVKTSWITIDTSAAKAFMLAGSASAYVAQDEPTTPQLIDSGNFIFSPGRIMVDRTAFSQTLPPTGRSEYEWTIKSTGNAAMGITYYFRQAVAFGLLAAASTPPLSAYPSITTVAAAALPVTLTHFSVRKEGGKVRMDWATANEQNSDRFDVLRSPDGQTWKTVAQVQSVGNATATTNYSVYDDRPLSGLNYYRLKQIDKDGKAASSEVKSVRLSSDVAISVWPNPASSYINFSLQEAAANVVATLLDATGRTVQQELFSNLQAGTVNKLGLTQKFPAGIYVLMLKGDGFSETRKVIFQ